MPEEFTEENWERLNLLFAERMRWASLSVTIEEIAKDNKSLVLDIANYNQKTTVSLLASLLTIPEYQSNCIRFEILIALAVKYCRGSKKVDTHHISRWFSLIGRSICVIGEDSAEDVFVSLVIGRDRDYRLIDGVWEAAGFYTQRVLEVIDIMPDTGRFLQIKKCVRALLVISDLVCEKAGLSRYQLGSDTRHSTLPARVLPKRRALISRVTISLAELDEHGIVPDDVEPFVFRPQMRDELAEQQVGLSYLERCPLIAYDAKHLTVALPSAVSVAVRDYVIAYIIENELTGAFDDMLAKNYSMLLFDTPLFGGPLRAPVRWMRSGTSRLSNFCLKIDEGYFVSFHLFLPSVQIHPYGGFKENFLDEGSLSDVLQTSINEVVKHFEGQGDFKEGLVVVVGCGWGKGYATNNFELSHQHWRFESMSVADLVRLSWLTDMSPNYFWRIQDGLEAIEKAGVEIVNPNGILNLIGWVRSNEGHFVPHAQLPQGEISAERPLLLNPPLNLLREVRADSDRSLDRHCVVDNAGLCHIVQHASPKPFFSSEITRAYASMDELREGRLTSVYEGAFKLWISVAAPDISRREVVYRLWEMATEWLYRIGDVLGGCEEVAGRLHNLKVYVEFRGVDPSKEWGDKPSFEELLSLCAVEAHSEPFACKAIFKPGFFAGFRIAENIAEHIFVRTVVLSYLRLVSEKLECKAEEIANIIVKNDDARSFHLFHAQQFIDYVRDTLHQNLITVDPLDDAALKIGLGWRVLGKGEDCKIEGIEACTCFLGKVVDVLLAETVEALKKFNRLSTLTRLVANCEKANLEEDHWKRTSAAILGLHNNAPDTVARYVAQMSKFAGANIASRVLIEIALCVCPVDGGCRISDIELSKLIARAGLVARIGGLSDAIYYNALAPELTISPLGDILFRDDFGCLVVEPMLTRKMGDDFIANASLQKRNYEEPGVFSQTKGAVTDEFWDIWKIEMGFYLDEARFIIDALEDKGIQDNSAIFTISQSAYIDLVCPDRVPEVAARMFLDQFSLSSRPRWDKPPKGFSRKDLYPWRFGRRLSFISRPILRVCDGDDPLLVIAPGALRKGFAYVLDGAYNGRFEQAFFRTKEMRDVWWGKASEGHTFNAEVARRLSEAGWQVRENIGLPEIFNQKTDRNYGDVDVLAWRFDRNDVLIIECKDLAMARNYSEIAALLSDYQGVEVDGKADKLRKHLDRVAFLQKNCALVKRFTGTTDPLFVSCLVCSGVVPMQYAKIDALSGSHVGGIEYILRELL